MEEPLSEIDCLKCGHMLRKDTVRRDEGGFYYAFVCINCGVQKVRRPTFPELENM